MDHLCLWYPRNCAFDLVGFTDADLARHLVDRKSTSGTAQFLGPCLISWASKKQNSVATSTAEAEYVAAASCCSQILWLKQQLKDFGISLPTVPIKCDNTSAINIAKNPVHHSRTKHIDIRHHFLRDNVEKGFIRMDHCRTEDQIADIFTKPLDRSPFEHLRLLLGMISLNWHVHTLYSLNAWLNWLFLMEHYSCAHNIDPFDNIILHMHVGTSLGTVENLSSLLFTCNDLKIFLLSTKQPTWVFKPSLQAHMIVGM